MKDKSKRETPKHPIKPSQGNKTEGSKNYKDPVGKGDNSGKPKDNSGYDEKQPI